MREKNNGKIKNEKNEKLLCHDDANDGIVTCLPKKEIFIKCRGKSGDPESVNNIA